MVKLGTIEGDYSTENGMPGDNINFSHPEKFQKDNPAGTLFDVHGWITPLPKVGDTLVSDFKKSYIKFKFVEVNPCEDPRDMFFAKVEPLEQHIKSTGEVRL